jgi:paraquat-inducible protein A
LFRRHPSAVDLDAEHQARQRIECPNCGLLQLGGACMRREITFCCRCGTPLVRRVFKSLDATLAGSIAILLLLIPAMLEPFLTTSAFGATRTSVLPMSASFLWREGWPLLALLVCLFVMVFPIVRFGALTAVLLAIRTGQRPAWLGFAFRVANSLQTWAMLDVFLLGMAVAYARLRVSIHVTIDAGAFCFVAAAVLSLFVRATLDKAQVWRLIAPGGSPLPSNLTPASDPVAPAAATVACVDCGLLRPADCCGDRCPRCTAVIRERQPESIARSSALTIAAALLYLPANLYPIATIPIDVTPTAYTVIGGVFDLAESHLLGLALLVFCASFAIPLLKMAGLSWCIAAVLRRSNRGLLARTRVYRIIEELGRWSMVDPLTIACFVPVLHFNGLIDGRAEPAATPFAAVVILTTLASKFFDPRLMWDAAERST